MRLFTSIDLPDQISQNLEGLVGRLRPTARLRWGRLKNLHITTKFIGEWPAERLEELIGALGKLPRRGDIEIAVRELGWFPSSRAPRVFWAGVEGGDGLAELARDTDQAASRLGVPAEERRFSPHLTLARIKPLTQLRDLKDAIEAMPSVEFGSFTADRFHLYASELRPSGAEYNRLAEFLLGAADSEAETPSVAPRT